ncbi:ImmA/IrrE family metallo-endopeptidase [Vibrio sp. JC009]|uniref:ImmA/IrrE family metallo-endopeptidase n=1 Tax=Vibrio sp. JC009 TaxID=2912314 RepID=UPI0023B112CA|nr:ImmA/IrrE family metallo-endopeptidase [Vibrio sp. JC009]WED21415.1 ImmA/IrrE family metallo-endopeptidase [Vibrio sp. JC009]
MSEPKSLKGWLTYFQQNSPADVEALCKQLGIECIAERMPDSVSGYIERISDFKYRIAFNAIHPRVRQRFTIAHELGHFYQHREILGYGTGDNKAYRSIETGHDNPNIKQRHETEANAFAADLLMPKNLIEEWRDAGYSFYSVKRKLDVSESALRFRLQNLNIELSEQ